ncbi:hypothetical protein A5844_000918 [Enterococcus sp. 10A9_DIV0425]|uniref:WxL domain-containing protein n=1 Tax=Candidatus Enterococcus wittei TaxID=1987383 RepID=A0A242K0I5_9ENTE|nr:hypothetical protein [Enterococcus sp. 10A9_DIV0425]OTP10784.1 hypothetical protein A5844_000918 [Enterococcus sp. 10A9_DIV0425]THE10787.1 hypothetical protein E1H99_09240 [Enterococcus hirae]
MKFLKSSIVLMAVSVVGTSLIGVAANAATVPNEEKDSNTEVSFTDSTDPDAVLKLIHVPDVYKFETKLDASGTYSITGGIVENDRNITVFNDKSTQEWSVKASIVNDQLLGNSKAATVTAFQIDGVDLMGASATGIVHRSNVAPDVINNTGQISKPVSDAGLQIEFNNANMDLKAGDVLTGTVHYQLFNTPDAQ